MKKQLAIMQCKNKKKIKKVVRNMKKKIKFIITVITEKIFVAA
jgi:ABC-type uncharacterized transport system ATPase subunit